MFHVGHTSKNKQTISVCVPGKKVKNNVKHIFIMAERWLAMHASNGGSVRFAGSGTTSVSQSGGLRHSVAHDSAHESDDRRTPSRSRLDGIPPIEASPGRSERAFRSGNERLYEAYNDLHALAQDFEKPFDAPAILVVGHQTDGKSGMDVCLVVFFLVFWLALPSINQSINQSKNETKLYDMMI